MATSVDAKLLKATKFPPEFNQKVDMQKVNLEVMKRWIAGKISSILGNEDDVVIELCFNLIEGARHPDIKKLQIQLTGFLEKDTASFCKELWKLCLSAQNSPQGVPKELLEAKKLELIQEKIDAKKATDEGRRQLEADQRREKELESIRNRERGDRGRGGGRGDSWRSGRGERGGFDRGGRDFDRRGPRRSSRSPPRRRDSRDRGGLFRGPPPPRDIDTYVPANRGGRRRDEPRRRSPSASLSPRRSFSRSRTPPRRRRSLSKSQSPPRRRRSPPLDRRRGSYRGRDSGGRGRSLDRGHRRRSYSPSNTSRSRSRTRKRRRSPSTTPSPSPPPRSRHRSRRNTSSRSRSRSSSVHSSRRRTAIGRGRAINSPAHIDKDLIRPGVNARKGRERDERRLTRSNSRDLSLTPPRRRRRSSPRSLSRSPVGRDRKRRRSIQRYAPANRKRNTSSVSSPNETRHRRADSSEDESARRSPAHKTSGRSPIPDMTMSRKDDLHEVKFAEKQTSELREKLLREKIKKMRTFSASSSNSRANNT